MNLLKTLCTLDVYHAQFNVVDRDTLIDAQAHPEKHKDLLVVWQVIPHSLSSLAKKSRMRLSAEPRLDAGEAADYKGENQW